MASSGYRIIWVSLFLMSLWQYGCCMSDARDLNRFIIRMPEGLRDRIAMAAEEAGRSMNSEIVKTLEEKYPEPSLDELTARVEAMMDAAEKGGIDKVKMVYALSLLTDAIGKKIKEIERNAKAKAAGT